MCVQDAVASLESRDAILAQRRCRCARGARDPSASISHGPSVQSDEIAAPRGQLQREPEAALAAAIDRDRLIADFPAVAVRTVEHAAAVQLAKAVDLRHVVDDAGGEQELARRARARPTPSVTANRCRLAALASVTSTWRSSHGRRSATSSWRARREELERRHAVAGEISVHRVRGGVARLAGVADEDATAGSGRGSAPR